MMEEDRYGLDPRKKVSLDLTIGQAIKLREVVGGLESLEVNVYVYEELERLLREAGYVYG